MHQLHLTTVSKTGNSQDVILNSHLSYSDMANRHGQPGVIDLIPKRAKLNS
jgi:hypothetical protein